MKLILRIRDAFALNIPIFFMCLYAHAQRPEPSGPVQTGVPDSILFGLIIGDSLPEWFWNLTLNVVNHPVGRSSVRLDEFRNKKLLVLDFWATYCSPCVRSLDKWDTLLNQYADKVSVLAIHLFHHPHLAEPFAQKRGWSIPIATGNRQDTLLNNLFYARTRFGQVWIKDGKLLAIPKNTAVTPELVKAVLAEQPVEIEMEIKNTYFDTL